MKLSTMPPCANTARSTRVWKPRSRAMASAGAIVSLSRVKPTMSTNMTTAVLGPVEAGGRVAGGEPLDHGRGEIAREVGPLALEARAAAGARRPAARPSTPSPPAAPRHSAPAPRARPAPCTNGDLDQPGPGRQQHGERPQRDDQGERRPASSAVASAISEDGETVQRSGGAIPTQRSAGQDVVDRGGEELAPRQAAGERSREPVAGTGGRGAQHHDPPAQRRGREPIPQQVDQRVGRQRAVRPVDGR